MLQTITPQEMDRLIYLNKFKSFVGILKYPHGRIEYYKYGLKHRVNGPAVIDKKANYLAYYIHDVLHRIDGPAVICSGQKQYYINGIKTDKEGQKSYYNMVKLKGL